MALEHMAPTFIFTCQNWWPIRRDASSFKLLDALKTAYTTWKEVKKAIVSAITFRHVGANFQHKNVEFST